MGAEQQDNELTDVVLCYQAMGVPLDASPVQIEALYKSLSAENKKKIAAPDPRLREEGKQNQELVDEMYQKIIGSATYRSMEQEYQKKKALNPTAGAKEAKIVHRVAREKPTTMNCPRCNGNIAIGLKSCPICKSRLYTPFEQLTMQLFSRKALILYLVLLLLAGAGFFLLNQSGDKNKDGGFNLDAPEQKTAK